MKQLTQSEIRKNGKVYKNVSSPATEGTMKQVTDIVEKDGTFSISTDGGKTYSPASGAVPEALPQEASALKSGNLPTSGWTTIGISTEAAYAYTISDTSITANSDILMELTDDGGVKAYSMEAGKMTVIRDTVPTQPIPYTYKVKQTNASGQFTLVNHFVPNVPVTSVNGQTGAVTIAVPKKTSQLENDSGFLTQADIPTTPTSLPVTYKKVSGELPISGWSTPDEGWKAATMPASRHWGSVIYGNDKFVAVADSSANGAYSTDGITWSEMTLPASRDWTSVTYGNGKYVAVTQNNGTYGAYSTDGITWTEMSMPASRGWQSVTYGNGKYVAVAYYSDKGAYSTDGVTWTEMTMPEQSNWYGVTYGNGKFVAVASGSESAAYSTDGISWTKVSMPVFSGWHSVAYGDGKFVAVADSNTNKCAYSTDGITWTEATLPVTDNWYSVAYGDGKFVAVVAGANKGAYSTDGINWSEMTLLARSNWTSVTYGNGKYVAVAYSSANAAYWEPAAGAPIYTIADTFITANTSVKMYLTDAGGVKAYSKANGSITVIRDTVPTTAIPYEYEVEQTSAEGLFEVINAYVPSAGEWKEWTSTSVLTEEGLYEIVTTEYPNDGNKTFFVQYEQGKPNNGACWVSVLTAGSVTVVSPICSGDGTLRVERSGSGSSTTEPLSFKYRKITN